MFNTKTDPVIVELNVKRKIHEKMESLSEAGATMENEIENFYSLFNSSIIDGNLESYDKENANNVFCVEIPFLHTPKGAPNAFYSQLTGGRKRIYEFSFNGVDIYRIEITSEGYLAFKYTNGGKSERIYLNTVKNALNFFSRKILALNCGVRIA